MSNDTSVGTVDTPDASDKDGNKGKTEAESGIFTSVRSRWNQWRGDNDTEENGVKEHNQDNSSMNSNNNDNDGHSHDSISSSTEASQQSQASSNEKSRFTDGVEDNTSEAKEESKTETGSTGDMDNTADNEDISE